MNAISQKQIIIVFGSRIDSIELIIIKNELNEKGVGHGRLSEFH